MTQQTHQEALQAKSKFEDNFPKVYGGVLLNVGRLVHCETSYIGPEVGIAVKVFRGNKLSQLWSGNASIVMSFEHGGAQWEHTYPNGDKHIATIAKDNGKVTLTRMEQGGDGKWQPYYSTSKTKLTQAEWDNIVQLTRLALDYYHACDVSRAKDKSSR